MYALVCITIADFKCFTLEDNGVFELISKIKDICKPGSNPFIVCLKKGCVFAPMIRGKKHFVDVLKK